MNSTIASMQGVLFKIIGNEYIKNLEIKNLKKGVKKRFLVSKEDILFFEDENTQFKVKGKYFIKIKKLESLKAKQKKQKNVLKDTNIIKTSYKIQDNWENVFIIIAGKKLKNEKYSLNRDYRGFRKTKAKFLIYFTEKEELMDENNQFYQRRLNKFKKQLKNNNYDFKNFYSNNELLTFVKKDLMDIIATSKEKIGKNKITDKIKINKSTVDCNNQYSSFYILTAIGKYLIENKITKKEKIAIDNYLENHQAILNEYNKTFLENSLINSAKHLIKTKIINPSKNDSKRIVKSIEGNYEKEKNLEKLILKIEEFPLKHGFSEDSLLKEKIITNNFINRLENQNEELNNENFEDDDGFKNNDCFESNEDYGSYHDFELLKEFNINDLNTIYPLLEYIYQIKDSKLRVILEEIKKELNDKIEDKNEYINSHLMYLSTFLFDLNQQLSYFHGYLVDLYGEGIIENFFTIEEEEFENEIRDFEESIPEEDDFYSEIEEEIFNEIEEKESNIADFIISTNDFLDDWNYYYNLFRDEFIKTLEINIKLLILTIVYMQIKQEDTAKNKENDDKEEKETNRNKYDVNKIFILIDYIEYQIQISINYLQDIKQLNSSLENIKIKKINKQYDLVRKSINKWISNLNKVQKSLKIINKFK
ncbi:MAG: hypothetical protein LBU40_04200 [Methanobrevibacter sp.]|nr:hypothetical protein [Methanobrevibacter sp.]